MSLLCSITADSSPHSLRKPESLQRCGSLSPLCPIFSHSPIALCSNHTSLCHSLNIPTLFLLGAFARAVPSICSLPSESCMPHYLVFQICSQMISSVSFLSPNMKTKLPACSLASRLVALPHLMEHAAQFAQSLCFLPAPQLEKTRNVFSFLTLNPQLLEQCLEHSRCSINICQPNGWIFLLHSSCVTLSKSIVWTSGTCL